MVRNQSNFVGNILATQDTKNDDQHIEILSVESNSIEKNINVQMSDSESEHNNMVTLTSAVDTYKKSVIYKR